MNAGELMTRQIVTVGRDATVREAVQQLNRHGITSMPVVDDDRIVGVLSEADLLRGEVFDDGPAHRQRPGSWPEPTQRTVGDVMTAHVISITEGVEAVDIARVMLEPE